MASKKFNEIEIDALGEIMNISLGSSATAISTMLDTRVDITTPEVRVVSKDEFSFTNLQPAVGVEITYISGLDGKNVMLLKRRDVKIIIELLMGMEIPDDEFELDEMNISAICEVMNQMMGASSTALSEFLGQVVNISTPKSFEIADEQEFKDMYFENDEQKVVIGFTLTINEKMESEFVNVMSVNLAKELVSGFLPDSYLIPEGAEEEMA
ncbi:MAG: chemotaxis protein CheC, partial [Hungatella sp.]